MYAEMAVVKPSIKGRNINNDENKQTHLADESDPGDWRSLPLLLISPERDQNIVEYLKQWPLEDPSPSRKSPLSTPRRTTSRCLQVNFVKV